MAERAHCSQAGCLAVCLMESELESCHLPDHEMLIGGNIGGKGGVALGGVPRERPQALPLPCLAPLPMHVLLPLHFLLPLLRMLLLLLLLLGLQRPSGWFMMLLLLQGDGLAWWATNAVSARRTQTA
eukprot:776123-Pelagomonas_calceolata.AAC.2